MAMAIAQAVVVVRVSHNSYPLSRTHGVLAVSVSKHKHRSNRQSHGLHMEHTLPPSTSSPIIKQAAVWMSPLSWVVVLVLDAMMDDVMDARGLAAELWA